MSLRVEEYIAAAFSVYIVQFHLSLRSPRARLYDETIATRSLNPGERNAGLFVSRPVHIPGEMDVCRFQASLRK